MKALLFLIAVIFSLAACQSIVETNNSLILVPPSKPGQSVILIGLEGAFCDAHVYIGIFQTIQNYSNFSIWAGLPKFSGIPTNFSEIIYTSLGEVRAQGANSSDVFMVGHSIGGLVAQDFLAQNSTGFKGLVLLGKFISFEYKDPQINFPVPVLTISGELDGLTKISRIAMSFNQMLRHPQGLGHIHFPVAIIPGGDHSSYITGYIPPIINGSDIKPETSDEQVWNTSAMLIDAFVDVQLHLNSLDTNPGAKLLFEYVYGSTYPLMKPLLDAFALEGNPYLYNISLINTTKWILKHIYYQMNLSSIYVKTLVKVDEIYNLTDFNSYYPIAHGLNLLVAHYRLEYQIYTHKEIGIVESNDIAHPPNQSALWISTKYKNANYIHKAIGNLEIAPQISCKSLNQKAINETLATVPEKTLERYQKYGVKLVAGDDIEYSNETSWNNASAVYQDHGDYIVFSSPRFYTKADNSGSSGNFYCKLLSPAKVAEWVYVDSLRKYDGAGVNNDPSGQN